MKGPSIPAHRIAVPGRDRPFEPNQLQQPIISRTTSISKPDLPNDAFGGLFDHMDHAPLRQPSSKNGAGPSSSDNDPLAGLFSPVRTSKTEAPLPLGAPKQESIVSGSGGSDRRSSAASGATDDLAALGDGALGGPRLGQTTAGTSTEDDFGAFSKSDHFTGGGEFGGDAFLGTASGLENSQKNAFDATVIRDLPDLSWLLASTVVSST